MDLNSQYSRHQHALILAAASDRPDERETFLGKAGLIARGIAAYQEGLDAPAALGWRLSA